MREPKLCSNLQAKSVTQNERTKAFQMGSMHMKIKEKFKQKAKLTMTKFKNQLHTSPTECIQLPNAYFGFEIHPLNLEIYR